jgi:hypothetical protein
LIRIRYAIGSRDLKQVNPVAFGDCAQAIAGLHRVHQTIHGRDHQPLTYYDQIRVWQIVRP